MDLTKTECSPLLGGSGKTKSCDNDLPSLPSTNLEQRKSDYDSLQTITRHIPRKLYPSLDYVEVDEESSADINLLVSPRYQWYSKSGGTGTSAVLSFEVSSPSTQKISTENATPLFVDTCSSTISDHFSKLPGLIIALLLNLFLSISFGQAFFPTEWTFPPEVPRAIGVQMFLFSTIICQVVMTTNSEFPCAVGMMMVENIPFMHTIANTVLASQGTGIESFSTILVVFALCSLICGLVFYALGAYELGNIVHYFPRHVIVGCIGGVGVFVTQTGFEVSCNQTWLWSWQSARTFTDLNCLPLWCTSCLFVLCLRICLAKCKAPMLPPLYFVAIPPMFYLIMVLMGFSRTHLINQGWFFESAEHARWDLQWSLIQFKYVDWSVAFKLTPTIIAMTIFSLMHVPINIPSLSMSTKVNSNMNSELKAHGLSNIIAGCCGGSQNYLCYSNSLLYFKCKGGGKLSGYLLAAITGVFFVFGPSIISFVPRCMAGCLLIHVGIDLFAEAIFDSYGAFDIVEYGSILTITGVMSVYGMTAGLGVGCVLAAFTFTYQTQHHTKILRGQKSAMTLRSTSHRSTPFVSLLQDNAHRIHVMHLQGNIFFGNATVLSGEISKVVQQCDGDIWCLLLDFTLVVGIDSSAVEIVAKIPNICGRQDVKVCFARGSMEGFPCEVGLSDRLSTEEACLQNRCDGDLFNAILVDVNERVHVCDDLNSALVWCENQVVVRAAPHLNPVDPLLSRTHVRTKEPHLRQMYFLHPEEEVVDRVLRYFKPHAYLPNEVIWHQGSTPNCAVLLVEGQVISEWGDEAGTKTMIGMGHLVGEYGLMNNRPRFSTMRAHSASGCRALVLGRDALTMMEREEPVLAFSLARICMANTLSSSQRAERYGGYR